MAKKLSAFITTLLMLLSFSFVAAPTPASAAIATQCQKSKFLGLPYWYQYLDVVYQDGSCSVSFDGDNPGKTAAGIGLAIFEIILRIGGLVAVAFVVVGGFMFITSTGEPERAKNARQTIINALIGLVITLVAAPLVSFLATRISP